MSRHIYIDESGISSNDRSTVVAGIIVKGDKHWKSVEEHGHGLIKKYVLEEHRRGFVFHALAVAMHFGIYNFVRKHDTLGTTPAVAAGIELERWSLERVVEMTEAFMRQKEDRRFEEAFAKAGM